SGLLHVCHHLRDCAWTENADGEVDALWRKWQPTARQLAELFPGKVSRTVSDALRTDPDQKIACYHIAVPARLYDAAGGDTGAGASAADGGGYVGSSGRPAARNGLGKRRFPFTCLYVEKESETLLEETGCGWFPYVVPRWATISGSQYARS